MTYVLFIAVPNAAPELISAYHLGPYDARVTWKPLNNLTWQSVSIIYVVTYQLVGDNNRATVESDVPQVDLNRLNPNSSYTVTVLARNRVGDGIKSNQMEFMTNLSKSAGFLINRSFDYELVLFIKVVSMETKML